MSFDAAPLFLKISPQVRHVTYRGLKHYLLNLVTEGRWWWREQEVISLRFGDYSIREAQPLRLCFPYINLLKDVIACGGAREAFMLSLLGEVLASKMQDCYLLCSLFSHTPVCSLFHLAFQHHDKLYPSFPMLVLVDERVIIPVSLVGCKELDFLRVSGNLKCYHAISEVLRVGNQLLPPHEPLCSLLKVLLQEVSISLRGTVVWEALNEWYSELSKGDRLTFKVDIPAWVFEEAKVQKILFSELEPEVFFAEDVDSMFKPISHALL